MIWRVTHRDKSGNLTHKDFEASNRKELFKILSQENISTVRINEIFTIKKSNNKLIKGALLFIALFFVFVFIGVIFRNSNNTNVVSSSEKLETKIDNNKKLFPTVRKTESKPTIKKQELKEKPTKVGEIVNGYVMLPSGRIHRRRGIVTNSVVDRVKAPYAIFEYQCENEIACLLSLKPGDFLIGTPRYNGRFRSEFIKSLQKPIVINPDDSEKTKQLKQAMIDTKKELSDAINRGEDIEQIMLNTRSELQDLMLYKMKMKQQFNELRKECKTNEDVELYLEACNKMLEEKGIAPIQLGPISKRNLILSN